MNFAMSPSLLGRLSQFVAARMGLHFPQERWGDLANGVASAAREHGRKDAVEYAQWLLSAALTRREIETLASHLTVGETYFFREKRSFEILEDEIIPELIRIHQAGDLRLRIWSAGCSTGEEAYSLAMILDKMIPDFFDWNVTILATDINPKFLESASRGIYGEWSFRAIPPGIRERYFVPLPEGKMQILRRIRDMVSFSFLNLAEDAYPSLVNNTNAMDLVLCRNVLMYFTAEHAARVVVNLHAALVDNGWLLVAPSETSHVLFPRLTIVNFPDAIFYRKSTMSAPSFPIVSAAPVAVAEPFAFPKALPSADARRLQEGDSSDGARDADSPILKAQSLANRGELTEALAWCDRAVSADVLNPAHRFLRAMVAQELGMLDEAKRFLEQALYLDQDFVMAHFALGNLMKRIGRHALSRKHFRSALRLLQRLDPDTPVSESAGLTAGRLTEIVRSTSEGAGETS
ncbi:MAG: CheR family methyltransferase [Spirochaetia bacterium]|jgi:chemotaxis protein methyltransferase CheR